MTLILLVTGVVLISAFVYSPEHLAMGIVGSILLVLGSMGSN